MNKTIISLESFIKHGAFGKVIKNMDLELAKSLLPKPDIVSGEWYGECILHYGDMVLESVDSRIDSIHIPMYDNFYGGSRVELDLWSFAECEEITLLFALGILNAESINFTVSHDPEEEIITVYLPQSNVTLEFWVNDDCKCEYCQYINPTYNYHLAYIYIE